MILLNIDFFFILWLKYNTMSIMTIITKLRSYKIRNFSIFDLVTSFFGMYILHYFFLYKYFSLRKTLKLTLPLSLLVHYILGIDTPLTRMILDPEKFWPIKFSMIYLLYSIVYN